MFHQEILPKTELNSRLLKSRLLSRIALAASSAAGVGLGITNDASTVSNAIAGGVMVASMTSVVWDEAKLRKKYSIKTAVQDTKSPAIFDRYVEYFGVAAPPFLAAEAIANVTGGISHGVEVALPVLSNDATYQNLPLGVLGLAVTGILHASRELNITKHQQYDQPSALHE